MATFEIDCKGIQDLIDKYIEKGGEIVELQEGSLGYGIVALLNNGLPLKEFIIKEYFINSWSSGHKISVYRKGIPKKYQEMLENCKNL